MLFNQSVSTFLFLVLCRRGQCWLLSPATSLTPSTETHQRRCLTSLKTPPPQVRPAPLLLLPIPRQHPSRAVSGERMSWQRSLTWFVLLAHCPTGSLEFLTSHSILQLPPTSAVSEKDSHHVRPIMMILPFYHCCKLLNLNQASMLSHFLVIR